MQSLEQLTAGQGKRKLATIQVVASSQKHPNADTLYITKFSTCLWQAVTKRQYCYGDHVAMFEPDSVFSNSAVAEAAGWPAELKYVKPTKLRGILSEVYVCPAENLAKWLGFDYVSLVDSWQDLSETLGITKYCKPEQPAAKLAGDIGKRNLFTEGLIPKTDEERLQSSPWLLEQTCSLDWYVTEKLDGTSTTYAWHNGEFHVAGRNFFLTDKDNAYAKFAGSCNLRSKMQLLDRDLAVQGELCGPKIQKNRLGLKANELSVFRVWDIAKQQPLLLSEALLICDKLGLKFVKVLAHGYGLHPDLVSQLTELANGLQWQDKPAEGIVVSNSRCSSSFKIINSNFR